MFILFSNPVLVFFKGRLSIINPYLATVKYGHFTAIPIAKTGGGRWPTDFSEKYTYKSVSCQ